MTILEQAICLNPNSTYAYFLKAYILGYKEPYDEALTAYDQMIRIDPNDDAAYMYKCIFSLRN